MGTDAGDVGSVASSTLTGAAAGSVFGPVGTAIGGTIGFISGMFSNAAESEAERLATLQVERNKIAAGISNEARTTQLLLNSLSIDRRRQGFAQQAFLANEAVTASGAVSGLMGSSIAKNAKASMGQKLASGLQFSYLSEALGEKISDLNQAALNAQLGILSPEEQAAKDAADAAALAAAQEQARLDSEARRDKEDAQAEQARQDRWEASQTTTEEYGAISSSSFTDYNVGSTGGGGSSAGSASDVFSAGRTEEAAATQVAQQGGYGNV